MIGQTASEEFGSKTDALVNAQRLLSVDPAAAAEQAQEVISGDPESALAYRILGSALRRLGKIDEARKAEDFAVELTTVSAALFEAALKLADNRLDLAEALIRQHLEEEPDDPAALRLLAEIASRTGNLAVAEQLLERALLIMPDYNSANGLLEYVRSLRDRRAEPQPTGRSTLAVGDSTALTNYRSAVTLYELAIARHPERPDYWLGYGHVLRAVGRQADAVSAYRHTIGLLPTFGEAWWALADLKTNAFNDDDAPTMLRLLESEGLRAEDRNKLHFAVARALEQKGDYEAAFNHFRIGNRERAAELGHDRQGVTQHVDKSVAMFDRQFFADRQRAGLDAQDPIFIIGMPRAGSTLVEQILSSHPQIEATMELPDIGALAGHLAGKPNAGFEDSPYLEKLASLNPTEIERLGRSYMWSSGLRRTTDRPYFIDKMPNNWMHVGLILTVFPNARIIDVRRHPLDCGVSNYRQLYGQAQAFSYDLRDFGSYYMNYLRLMGHFDRTLPSRVHRVIYEQLIESPEPIIRELLDYVGVSFDSACLRFHENKRAVRTASSEQVRQPLNRSGVGQWQQFERWLGELIESVGPAVSTYPAAPDEP